MYIISSCGFDSIPADLGTLYLKDKNQDVEFKSVTGYIDCKNPKGFAINTGTFFSLLESLRNAKQLKPIRTEMFGKFYKKKYDFEKPKLKIVHRAPYASGLFLPFWNIDAGVVKRTQSFFYENENEKPLSLIEYLHVPSIAHAIGLLFAIMSIGFFNLFSFTRSLMKKYPALFTFGVFSSVCTFEKC